MSEPDPKTIPIKTRLGIFAVVLLSTASVFVVTGCSDSGEEAATTGATDGGVIVTGSAECDRSSIEKAVSSWAEAYGDGEKASLPDSPGSFRCADGWAVAFPEVGPPETSVTVTAVFEAEGQFWVPKDRSKVCGDAASNSEVPPSLYRDACQTN